MLNDSQGLANKYRPRTFEEYRGNAAAIALLQNYVFAPAAGPEYSQHAILLGGNIGGGKSTLARLFAETLTRGETAGVIEYNMSSKNTVGDARALEEEIHSPSILAPVRVFILEEAHRITNDSADILLTTIEHLPRDVFVIFVTTEPRALRPALRDRLLQVHLQPLEEADVRAIINLVCAGEGFTLTHGCTDLLVRLYSGRNRTLINNIALVAGCKNVLEAETRLTAALDMDSEDGEIITLVQTIASATQQGFPAFQQMLGSMLEKLKAAPEPARLAAGTYLSKLACSPRNVAYLPHLAPILGQLGEGPLTYPNAHLRLVAIFTQAYFTLASLNR